MTLLAAKLPGRDDGQRRPSSVLSSMLAEALIVVALIGWWWLSRTVPHGAFPGIGAVFSAMAELLIDAEFAGHTLASAVRVVISVLVALALGTILALIPHYVPALNALVHDRIKPFFNSFPSVGWAALIAVWMHMSSVSVTLIQVMILLPFCLINVSEGVRALDHEISEMGESFTRSRWRVLFRVELPALVPFMLAAARMAYGVCWKVALVAELFGARSGLGHLMQIAQDNADVALLFATCFMVVLFFRLGELLVLDPLARRFNWNESDKKKAYV